MTGQGQEIVADLAVAKRRLKGQRGIRRRRRRLITILFAECNYFVNGKRVLNSHAPLLPLMENAYRSQGALSYI